MGLKLKPAGRRGRAAYADIDFIRRLEDSARAVVLHSLFEEQIKGEAEELEQNLTQGTELRRAPFLLPSVANTGWAREYLDHIRKAKKAVDIPVIASLNGATVGGWTDYAKQIEAAGADALELNVYFVAANPSLSGRAVEALYEDILKAVKKAVHIPVAMKLSPFFSSMAATAVHLDAAGADGLVLFNRFYQPDIDLEKLEVVPDLVLSSPWELRLPLRWIAIMYGHVEASLAATSGIASGQDVLKAVMAGADVAQVVSVLLVRGVGELSVMLESMQSWMREHEYESIAQMKGSMSQKACPEPAAFERANYMKTLHSYR